MSPPVNSRSTAPSTLDKTVPDLPVGFGYKCVWFAVKAGNKNRIAEVLKLYNVTDCNWQAGIDEAYNGSVFITPAVDGWTLACGIDLPGGDGPASLEEVKGILQTLSKEFGETQFFATHRVVEYHCWIKASHGQIQRVYGYVGERGENTAIEGEPTDFEKSLNLANTFSEEAKTADYFERKDITWADEELVMKIAGNWSVNPDELDKRKDVLPALGLLGERF